MDHYRTLGLNRGATKEEIKEAFRRSALQFHPDRHAQSSEDLREAASLKFKQASEAYEVLLDDRRRADYDSACRGGARPSSDRWSRGGPFSSSSSSYSSEHYGGRRQYDYGYRRPPPPPPPGDRVGAAAMLFRLITPRGFLVGMAFASVLLGGAVVVERSMETIWKMNNSGKSFEEAMESIEQIKAQKENN
ncbi:chaperone protein dnaJ 72-like [Curcuma longa]|uniref:chaperone protein dnaJ 72-like n=1 Tax=Curcuma longa TaxID=136217 RepID=UPI003D9E3E2C